MADESVQNLLTEMDRVRVKLTAFDGEDEAERARLKNMVQEIVERVTGDEIQSKLRDQQLLIDQMCRDVAALMKQCARVFHATEVVAMQMLLLQSFQNSAQKAATRDANGTLTGGKDAKAIKTRTPTEEARREGHDADRSMVVWEDETSATMSAKGTGPEKERSWIWSSAVLSDDGGAQENEKSKSSGKKSKGRKGKGSKKRRTRKRTSRSSTRPKKSKSSTKKGGRKKKVSVRSELVENGPQSQIVQPTKTSAVSQCKVARLLRVNVAKNNSGDTVTDVDVGPAGMVLVAGVVVLAAMHALNVSSKP